MHKWLPAAALMLVSIISYVDRNTLALLAPSILKETGLSIADYGWAVSAYSVAFMVGNPVWGRLLDRIGLPIGMTAAVLLWTAASVGHAFAAGFVGFAAARAVLGFGEGAAAPGGLRTVMQTLPPRNRSRGIAMTYSGGSAGAIATPLLITPVAALFGWRGAFWFTGVLGLAWVGAWIVLSRRKDIRAATVVEPGIAPAPRPRWSDRRLWAFLLCYSLGALPLGFVVYSSAIYLSRVFGLTQLTIGALAWIPPLGSEVGIFFWGWLADRSASKLTAVSRLLPIAAGLSVPLAFLPWGQSVTLALAQFFLAMFVASAFQLLAITYGSETFAKTHAGLVGGIGSGAYGAVLAIAMPRFGWLFDHQLYNQAFSIAALCPVAGYALWRGLHSSGKPFSQTQD
ncbi:MAG: MFS transporter [Bryobacteraceae bacterium]|nr:MFS transporter [Bryobacteraceae bacterium]